MSLDLGYSGWQQEKRQRRRRWVTRLIVLVLLIAAGMFVFSAGQESAKKQVSDLEARIESLTATQAQLEAKSDQLALDEAKAEAEAGQWKSRYDAEVPNGPARGLLVQLKKQLDAGVPADRIGLMVDAAGKSAKCPGQPVSKRFLVKTPISGSGNDSITFADNAVTVTATGEPSVGNDGKTNAWFDPEKPITVRFVRLGGKGQEITGVLPIHHSFVLEGDEIRVSLIRGDAPGFVRATGEKCELPK
jgi:outer membrane murein-binding lipoprotein Lpp